MLLGEPDVHMQKNRLLPHTMYKINLKQAKDGNVRAKTNNS